MITRKRKSVKIENIIDSESNPSSPLSDISNKPKHSKLQRKQVSTEFEKEILSDISTFDDSGDDDDFEPIVKSRKKVTNSQKSHIKVTKKVTKKVPEKSSKKSSRRPPKKPTELLNETTEKTELSTKKSTKKSNRKTNSMKTEEKNLEKSFQNISIFVSDEESEDDWDEVTQEVDEVEDDLAKMVRTTEEAAKSKSTTKKIKKESKNKDENSENEHVQSCMLGKEIHIKTEKSKQKSGGCKVMSFEDSVMMLIKRAINRNIKAALQDVHKTHLLILFHLGMKYERLTRDVEIKARLLSILPEKFEDFGLQFPENNVIEFTGSDELRFYDFTKERILESIETNSFTDQFTLAIAITVCLRFYGKTCRIVLSLEPLSFKEPSAAMVKKSETVYRRELATLKFQICKSESFTRAWVEIYDKNSESWSVFEFPGDATLNDEVPTKFDPKTSLPPDPNYIFAFSEKYQRDITAKYAKDWLTNTRKLRVASYDKDWWKAVLKIREKGYPRRMKNLEDGAMQKDLLNTPMPKTIGGFKSHPLFALERHLLKFEAFYPKDVEPLIDSKTGELATIRGENVYARSAVKVLHTPDKWLQSARQVTEGEAPYNYVASWMHNKKLGLDKDARNLAVYGKWQTEKYKPPVISDNGAIPRNRYGNINMYQPEMLPENARWLKGDYKGIKQVALDLGIDVVQAVIGWEDGGGRPQPKYDGWIVYEPHADKLVEGYNQRKSLVKKAVEDKEEANAKKQADKRQFPCKFCGKRLTRVQNRKVHIKMKHPNEVPY